MALKLYCNAFWPGFLEGTDPVSIRFFLELLVHVFQGPIELTGNIKEGDILLESIFGSTALFQRPWKYSILFSGESRIFPHTADYTCVLWGIPTAGNVVCCPLFLPYIFSTKKQALLGTISPRLPPKPRILVIISNPRGDVRNQFLDILERFFPIDYAGRYRNNVPVIQAGYDTDEFRHFVSQYRCVLAMENSQASHYLTEKITHGFLAGTVPIYWGAPSVGEYFNEDRFIHVKSMGEDDLNEALNKIMMVMRDDEAYLSMVQVPLFAGPNVSMPSLYQGLVENMRKLLRAT
jgi:hypothetical protein